MARIVGFSQAVEAKVVVRCPSRMMQTNIQTCKAFGKLANTTFSSAEPELTMRLLDHNPERFLLHLSA
jgi:hypothetical protein